MNSIGHYAGVFLLIFICQVVNAEGPKDFTVRSPIDGKSFTRSEHQGKIVVLHFLLKTECPYCLKYTHDYAKLAESTPDVVHLFLKPDSEEEIRVWVKNLKQDELKKLPTIYRDPDAELAKQFNIKDGYQFHGQLVHYPALVALDTSGTEMFRYVGKKNSDRMSPADFRSKLEEAKAGSSK